MLKIGNNTLGILSMGFHDNDINTHVIKISIFPMSIFFETHYDINHFEIRIVLLNKFTSGIFIRY